MYLYLWPEMNGEKASQKWHYYSCRPKDSVTVLLKPKVSETRKAL